MKNATGRWTFPKGKQKEAESLAQTAVREIQEETGLTGLSLMGQIGSTMFRFREQGNLIRKTVHYFLFQAPPDAKEHMMGLEGGMWEAEWVPLPRVFDVSSYRNLDRLLAKAMRMIGKESAKLST